MSNSTRIITDTPTNKPELEQLIKQWVNSNLTNNSDSSKLEDSTKPQTQSNCTTLTVTNKSKRKITQQNYSKPKRAGWFKQDNNTQHFGKVFLLWR